jgi:hypothetical protein
MQQRSISSPDAQIHDSWIHRVLGDQNFERQRGFFATWYRLTSLPDAQPGATFAQRDRVRRSRASSPNHTILFVVLTMFLAIFISIPINRHGGIEIVGILMVLGLTVGMYTSIGVNAFSVGMSVNDKDILYLLFFSELFAGAILPINWVFVVAAINVTYSFLSLRFSPTTRP